MDEHVPEALRPPEIDGQHEPTEADEGERDEIAEVDQTSIPALAEEIHQRREEVAACGETAQEKVRDDQPAPLRRRGEEGARHRGPPGSGS